MEVYDDRPKSVYDNLKTPTNNIRAHNQTTNTTKVLKNNNNALAGKLTGVGTGTVTVTGTAAATTSVNGRTATSPIPIYAEIPYKFDDSRKLLLKELQQLQQQQQQSHQKNFATPSVTQQKSQPGSASNYSERTFGQAKLQFAPFTGSNINSNSNSKDNGSINNYLNNNNSDNNNSNQQSIKDYTKASTTMPTTMPTTTTTTPAGTIRTRIMSPATQGTTATASTPTTKTTTQRPLSQHSQTDAYEVSQSIAAVKAALNDAKSKFFGLNGYAHDGNHQPEQNGFTPNYHNSNSNNEESRLREQRATTPPHLLIGNQFPIIQIVTTAPTPPPKSQQPKYQNIPENSAIFRNNRAAQQQQQQQQQPPELPPKPVEVIVTPARVIANSPTSHTQTDAAASTTANSATGLSPNSIQRSTTPTPSPMSPSHAAYKQIPLNDIDTAQPSQAVYMSTTVPQNIKGTKIAGRHTPTRNSLRHSRMLVVNNKTYAEMVRSLYAAALHPNPMNFRHPNITRWLLYLEIIVGLLISFLAIWIFCLAPNTDIQYNPYWSGLVLLLTGILGLVLVRYQRIKRLKVRENCFKFLRADIYLITILAILLSAIAFFWATLHYVQLSANDTHCASSNPLLEQGACTCVFNAPTQQAEMTSSAALNATKVVDAKGVAPQEELAPQNQVDDKSYKVEYRDLSCKEVRNEWTNILIYSMTLNSIGLLLSLAFGVLLVSCRRKVKRFYTSVQTSSSF